MKRLLIPLLLGFVVCLTACSGAQTADRPPQEKTAAVTEAFAGSTADEARRDPYATDNRYDIDEKMFEKRGDVDYGTVQKDVTYYSKTAGDNKQCNILLPSGYSESQTYPVMYVFHGFGGSHSNQIDTDSYLTLLYGNMLRDGLTKPMIIVNVDMYTDKLADKDSKTDEQLRYIYDKAIDDVALDLMPFIEQNYPVKTGRENTAVAGLSEGGAKSLCTGFKWLDKFGYIGAFAPDTGVIAVLAHLSVRYPSVWGPFPRVTQPSAARQQNLTVPSKSTTYDKALGVSRKLWNSLLPLDLHVL
ncbi:MAG: hypothetical protein II012_07825, partial [Ruminococcus sp.]|nr:hypothetical protein [Ruminococcus sp.]